jgi:hypothetical protein
VNVEEYAVSNRIDQIANMVENEVEEAAQQLGLDELEVLDRTINELTARKVNYG